MCIYLLYFMKVNLIKEAYYEINEKKSSNLPFMTFMKMCGTTLDGIEEKNANLVSPPNVRIFSKIDDFRSLSKSELDKFDTTKDVIVLPTGDFCVFLKPTQTEILSNTINAQSDKKVVDATIPATDKQQLKNVTTNTKEDPEDKATDLK